MATSLACGSASNALTAAPVPRPPQPTRPTRIVSSTPWNQPAGAVRAASAATPAVAEACRTVRRLVGGNVMPPPYGSAARHRNARRATAPAAGVPRHRSEPRSAHDDLAAVARGDAGRIRRRVDPEPLRREVLAADPVDARDGQREAGAAATVEAE